MVHGLTFAMPPSRSTSDLSEFGGPSCPSFAYGLTQRGVSEMPHRVERGATRSAASTRMGSHATETVARELGVTEGEMGRGKPPRDGREERGAPPGPWG